MSADQKAKASGLHYFMGMAMMRAGEGSWCFDPSVVHPDGTETMVAGGPLRDVIRRQDAAIAAWEAVNTR